MSEPSRIRYEVTDGLATLTLDDPSTLNAASIELADELSAALGRAEAEARAVILTGNGRGFCSGANLSAPRMANADPASFDAGEALETTYNPLVTRIRDLRVPIVTAVNGAAAGVGCSIALLGDLIVAAESAYFLQAFRRIGLIPDGGSTWLLPRMVGRARAMEMMLLGEKIPAAQALEWGMINKVVPDAALMDAARDYARRLADGPASLALIRRAAWDALDRDWQEQLGVERELQRDAGRTADFIEGAAAFLQKRRANFAGR